MREGRLGQREERGAFQKGRERDMFWVLGSLRKERKKEGYREVFVWFGGKATGKGGSSFCEATTGKDKLSSLLAHLAGGEEPFRLAQNREAARKSRLRKKVLVLDRHMSSSWSSHSMGGNEALAFDMGYARWLDEYQRLINDLRSVVNSHVGDNELHILVDSNMATYNAWSYDEHLIRELFVVACILELVQNGKSFSLKTMEDGQVLWHSNSVNARECKIPYPWLVFNEKIKVNSVFSEIQQLCLIQCFFYLGATS
ncbi:Transcription factor TGA2.3 [Vitis vinifera]|uniref:Transcription factor TGA2.3 n=1 Tax=Vitis vinifera TaxID=29760 RepID=A0A438FIL1_VITVI|nr:Transcription factor TGA2.3 [Vitis vinifera]